jgi:iron complex transport system permease protein
MLLNPSGNGSNFVIQAVIWDIRLPRALMGLIAGMTLALAGVALQGAMKNPLVCPFTIGISSGASFGAALAIVLGVGFVGFGRYVIMANAFIFALVAMAVAMGIAKLKGMAPESVILAGIAMVYLFSALVTLLQYMAHEMELKALVHWTMGDLILTDWGRVTLGALALIVCIPLFRYAWDLNALMMGEEVAKSLGTNPGRTRLACAVLSALAVAIIVCMTGPIAFIGLLAPHMARFIVGADYRFSMIGSVLLGGLLLMVADTMARVIIAPFELPVGVMTVFLGIPLFVHLLLKPRREIWM